MKKLPLTIGIFIALATHLTFVQAATTYTFQEGVNGYVGTHDTEIRGGTPDRDDGALDSLSIDTSDGGGQNHCLLRFENLSGSGTNQIPAGSAILFATLRLWITSDGNPPNLNRMLKPWTDSITWNTFDPDNLDGITADDVEAAMEPDASFAAPDGEPYFVEIILLRKTIQDWLDGKTPNHGWALLPTGSNGVDFHTSENSNTNARPLLTIVVGAAGEPFTRSFIFDPKGFNFVVEEGTFASGQTNAIDPASISVTLDGTKVAHQATKDGSLTTIRYVNPSFFGSGSQHTAVLSFADSSTPPKTFTAERPFTIAPFPAVPASFAVTGVDTSKAGFKVRVHQIPFQRPGGDRNNLNSAEKHLANAIINPDTGMPYDNEADLTLATNGIFEVEGVINWDLVPGPIGNFSANSDPAVPDELIPGIPGLNSSTLDFAAEILTYLELKTGFHRFGVNSDDGFRVSIGPNPHDVFATVLGFFDGGRGAGDTLFEFEVLQDAIYPVRLSWWQGTGGANVEFFSVDPATGTKTLINDRSNPQAIKAYRVGPTNVFGPRPGLKVVLAVDDKQIWKYDESGTDLGTAWREKTFNDTAWLAGPAALGFESGSVTEPLRTPVTPGMLTYYFRTRFNFDDDPAATQLRLLHIVDDGAVFYLNGVEVHRFGMPTGEIKFDTGATPGHENQYEGPFVISAANLVKGENALAVEVHQTDTGSSDLVFGLELQALISAIVAPKFTGIRAAGAAEFIIEWTGAGTLESADDVTGPWSAVSGAGAGSHRVQATAPRKFYRIKQ